MTPSELKANVEIGADSFFFTRDNMRFFGDTMRNYGVRQATIKTRNDDSVDCWELYRKRPVKHGVQSSAFFDKASFARVFPDKEV